MCILVAVLEQPQNEIFYTKLKEMTKRSNHVVPSSSRWAVKKTGSERASKTFDTKEKAVEYGRELSKMEKTELYIHKANGMIQNRTSYGNDPYPPKDTRY